MVIWALALLAAIAASFTSATRTAALIAANAVENAQAEALADSGARLAILGLGRFLAAPQTTAPVVVDGSERTCRIADLGAVRIGIESETGKVDLNNASDALLMRLLEGVGAKGLNAASLTDRIADFRDGDGLRRLNGAEADEYRRAGVPGGPKDAPFAAVEELGQVLGVSPELAARLRPYVTVYSSSTGIDPRLASADLVRVLTSRFGDRASALPVDASALPQTFVSLTAPNVFLIRSSAETTAGARFVREAIVEIADARLQKINMLRWYRAEGVDDGKTPKRATAASNPPPLPPC